MVVVSTKRESIRASRLLSFYCRSMSTHVSHGLYSLYRVITRVNARVAQPNSMTHVTP